MPPSNEQEMNGARKHIDDFLEKSLQHYNREYAAVPIQGALYKLNPDERKSLLAEYDQYWTYEEREDYGGFNGPDYYLFTPKNQKSKGESPEKGKGHGR